MFFILSNMYHQIPQNKKFIQLAWPDHPKKLTNKANASFIKRNNTKVETKKEEYHLNNETNGGVNFKVNKGR